MVYNQKGSKGLSGSVLAAFVAAVLLLAGSTVSANTGDKNKVDESGTMGTQTQQTEGFESDPFGGGPVADKAKDYVESVQKGSVEFTTNGLDEFASTAESFIQKGDGEEALKQSRKDLERSVKKIKDEKDPQIQAQHASQAFKDASTLLSDIQKQSHPEMAQIAQPVQSAADKITADKSLDMQLGEVQDFFLESARAFNQLSSTDEGMGGGPLDQMEDSVTPDTTSPPATPSEPMEPMHPDDPAGGGPSDGSAPPSGAPGGY